MTVQDYQPFVERMIQRYEGGYGWSPQDPGGPTKFGITCYDLAEHRQQIMDSMGRWAPLVRAMTLAEADDIYQTKYATACAFNTLDAGKDCVVFDFGVNSGSRRAVRYAQSVAGFTGQDVDGFLGPKTLAAINSLEARLFINGLCDKRQTFLESLPTFGTFGRGWTARVADLRTYSINLAYPPLRLEPESYAEEPERIPLAFAKAYGMEP